jgi:hypothetical protein
VADAARRRVLEGDAAACDAALREAVAALLQLGGGGATQAEAEAEAECAEAVAQAEAKAEAKAGAQLAQPPSEAAGALLRHLDERLCVPRDLGAPSAAALRALAQAAETDA